MGRAEPVSDLIIFANSFGMRIIFAISFFRGHGSGRKTWLGIEIFIRAVEIRDEHGALPNFNSKLPFKVL